MKFHIKKGDTVKVLAGNSKGKISKILKIYPNKYKAVVEDLNMVSKHNKPTAENPKGGIDTIEAPIHMSNLMLVDTTSGESTRIGRKTDDKGKLQRYSKKSGKIIKNG